MTRTLLTLALAAGLIASLPGTASATPPVPSVVLPVAVEDPQPYVGQVGCDPVAKPGVLAFQAMLMNTYRDTGSYGIVSDCGIGGQSEHKEGRAFDWKASITNPSNAAEVREVLDWLTMTVNGVPAANARRLGVMYMIWNRQIWGSYAIDQGWRPYSGSSPHTDHVHFSFGWNAAYKTTSWWTGKVAAVMYGPYVTPPPTRSSVMPVRSPGNLKVVASYGATTLQQGSTGAAVAVLQSTLGTTADGDFGPLTAAKVREFQADEAMTADGIWGPASWVRLYPKPIDPFGVAENGSMTQLQGWVADLDTRSPLLVQPSVDGQVQPGSATAATPRPDVTASYPGATAFGYVLPVDVPAGTHSVCAVAANVGAGATAPAGCRSVTVATADTRPGHWVSALYRDFLGRASDQGGLDFWYGRLQSGAVPTREALALTFARRDEYLDIVITRFYAQALGRQPDAGILAWRQALAAGASPAVIASAFYASPERYAAAGSTDGAWVDGLYSSLLGRAADPAGRQYWAAQAGALGRQAVAETLFASPESLARRVQALYQSLLGRAADPVGLAVWPAQVRDRGDLVLASSLAASPEYDARAQR